MPFVMINGGGPLKPGEVDGTEAMADEIDANVAANGPALTRAQIAEINARNGWTMEEAIRQMRAGTYPGV